MSFKDFLGCLPLLVQSLSQKYGVKFRMHGDAAFTNGEVVTIPAFADAPQTQGLIPWIRGFLDHEVGHVRNTDFSVPSPSGLLGCLSNVIEDIRVDALMAQTFPGSKINLAELDALLVEKQPGGYQDPATADHPGALIALYVMYVGRVEYLGMDVLKPFADQASRLVQQTLPTGLDAQVKALMEEIPSLLDTASTLDLSKRILDLLKEASEPEQSDGGGAGQDQGSEPEAEPKASSGAADDSSSAATPNPDQPQQSEDENPSDSSSDCDGQGDDEGESSSDSKESGDGECDSPSAPELGESGEGVGSESHDGDTSTDSSDNTDSVQGASASGESMDFNQGANDDVPDGHAGDASAGKSEFQGESPSEAMISARLGTGSGDDVARQKALQDALLATDEELPEGLGEMLQGFLNEAAGGDVSCSEGNTLLPDEAPVIAGLEQVRPGDIALATSGLRHRLSRLVQASRQKPATQQRYGTELDCKVLHRLAIGDPRVFERKQTRRAVNTAVMVLLDQSSSMSFGRSDLVATQASLALAMSLETIPGVKVAVTGFSDDEVGQPVVRPMLQFGQRASQVVDSFTPVAMMTTPLAEALWWSFFQLANRREERKLLIVVTDGQPNCKSRTKDVLEKMAGYGIEAIGIGIQVDVVRDVFSQSAVIQNVNDLPQAMFGLIQGQLLHAA